MGQIIKKHIKIFGEVQGVGFRYWLQVFAIRKGIFGWVRNTSSGHVEALLVGNDEMVLDLIEQCHMGPSTSKVNHISVEDYADNYQTKSFDILPSS